MAAIDTQIQIKQGNAVGLRESKNLELWFKALGIGTDNLQILQSASGQLQIVARLKIQDGVDASEVVNKGQLDSATGTVLSDVAALTTRVDTAEDDIDAAEGRLTVDEAAIVALDGRLDTAEADIIALDGRLDTAESTLISLDGRLDAAEATIVTHTGQIAVHESRLDTAEADIDQLQADLATIEANNPNEEEFTAIAAQVLFNLSAFTVDALNTVRDVEVFVDGRREIQATSGTFTGNKGWRKNSTSQIELASAPGVGRVVVIWKQGTAVVVSGGGGTDLQNITVNPQPLTNGSKSLGTVTKAWESVFLKDQTSAQVWKLQINAGVLEWFQVP